MSELPFRLQCVAVAGATGLVGQALVTRLLAHPARPDVVALVRPRQQYPHGFPLDHPRLHRLPFDAGGPTALCDPPRAGGVDAYVSALGSTLAKAGSPAALRAVDHHGVIAGARWALAQGAHTLAVVSSINANPRSRLFYPRMKADMERELAGLGAPRTLIAQPSLLTGARHERRPLEDLLGALAPLLDPLLVGRLRPFRTIAGAAVAAGLVQLLDTAPAGLSRVRSDTLADLASAAARATGAP